LDNISQVTIYNVTQTLMVNSTQYNLVTNDIISINFRWMKFRWGGDAGYLTQGVKSSQLVRAYILLLFYYTPYDHVGTHLEKN